MSAKVEFFEVGRKQAYELLDRDYAPGSYIVVTGFGNLGFVTSGLSWCPKFQDPDAIAKKLEVMYANDLWALRNGISNFANDYEIWLVMDDSELWDVWEKKVKQSKRHRHGTFGEGRGNCKTLDSVEQLRAAGALSQNYPKYAVFTVEYEDVYLDRNTATFDSFIAAETFCNALLSPTFPLFDVSITCVIGRDKYTDHLVSYRHDTYNESYEYNEDIPF